ncbi:MAG: hypothetical protein P1P90_03245 [Patescibacteria group bacterium]|nr:hypothetical protein [Patescibacteria group bacterium]
MTSEKKDHSVASYAFGTFQLWRDGVLVEERAEPPKQILQHCEEVHEVDEPGWVYVDPGPLLICQPRLFVELEPMPPLEENEKAEEIYKCREYGDDGFLLRPDMPIPGIQMDPDTGHESHEEDDLPYMNLEVEVCDGAEDVGSPEIDEDCGSGRQQDPPKPKRKQRAAKQDRLTTDQLAELLAIDKRVGLRSQLQRMLHALNSGGLALEAPAEDIAINYRCEWWEVERQRQALVLWQKGIGRALGYSSYQKYLASIPGIPGRLRMKNGKFNRLVLVDTRAGLQKLCHLAGVFYDSTEHLDADSSVRWMRCQDGRRYQNDTMIAADCSFQDDEDGLSLFEGICLYMQFPQVLCECFVILFTEPPNTSSNSADVAILSITELGVKVGRTRYVTNDKYMGVASKLRL